MQGPQGGGGEVEGDEEQVGRPPRSGQDRRGHDEGADGGADAVEAVEKIQQAPPAGKGDSGVKTAVHHPGSSPEERPDRQDEPQSGCGHVADAAESRARSGHGEQDADAEPLDQPPDERGDDDRSDRVDQQDQPEVTDRHAEAVAHRRPGGAQHPVGQADDDEGPETEQVEPAVRAGRAEGGGHWPAPSGTVPGAAGPASWVELANNCQ